MRVGDDLEISPFANRCEVTVGGTAPGIVAAGHLVIAAAVLRCPVEVGVPLNADLLGGINEDPGQRIAFAMVGNGDRPG